MSDEHPRAESASDPLTGGAVAGGILVGLIASIVMSFGLFAVTGDSGPGFWVPIAVPPVAGLVVLLVPRWRRVGAGFVLGLAVGGIVFAGVCVGFIAWLEASLGGL